jgi:hypothetical protein
MNSWFMSLESYILSCILSPVFCLPSCVSCFFSFVSYVLSPVSFSCLFFLSLSPVSCPLFSCPLFSSPLPLVSFHLSPVSCLFVSFLCLFSVCGHLLLLSLRRNYINTSFPPGMTTISPVSCPVSVLVSCLSCNNRPPTAHPPTPPPPRGRNACQIKKTLTAPSGHGRFSW